MKDETQDDGCGNYSVVTMSDSKSRKSVIVDPYKDFRSRDRIYTLEFFIARWWDMNNFPDPLTRKNCSFEDRQMMFMLTAKEETFPRLLGMKRE